MPALLTAFSAASEFASLLLDLALLLLGVQAARTVLDAAERLARLLTWLAEFTLLLLALLLSVVTDAVVWAAPRLGRLAGRAYRLGRRHWPTACRVAEAVRLTVARFVWTQAGYSPAPVAPEAAPAPCRAPLCRPVVAKALPGLLPALSRRQLLAVAKAARLPRYSRLSTDQLRAALGAV
ncbi:MAG: hypothetical protein ACO27M_05410 [Vulcanococcus sp.]